MSVCSLLVNSALRVSYFFSLAVSNVILHYLYGSFKFPSLLSVPHFYMNKMRGEKNENKTAQM